MRLRSRMSAPGRILVGTVGYHNLRNHSIGPILLPKLRRLSWPPGVEVEELNWGPVAVAQRLQAERPPFDRIVLIGARPGELEEGTITPYRWEGGVPEPEELQARMGEAVSGVISVDNLLVVGQHRDVWPSEVYLIDVAPGLGQEEGPEPALRIKARIPRILRLARETALSPQNGDIDWVPLRGDELESRMLQ